MPVKSLLIGALMTCGLSAANAQATGQTFALRYCVKAHHCSLGKPRFNAIEECGRARDIFARRVPRMRFSCLKMSDPTWEPD
jgi:hypothetical protein